MDAIVGVGGLIREGIVSMRAQPIRPFGDSVREEHRVLCSCLKVLYILAVARKQIRMAHVAGMESQLLYACTVCTRGRILRGLDL